MDQQTNRATSIRIPFASSAASGHPHHGQDGKRSNWTSNSIKGPDIPSDHDQPCDNERDSNGDEENQLAAPHMSAFGGKADIGLCTAYVR